MILLFKTSYKRPKIVSGDLRTPVTFFEYKPSSSPDPSEVVERQLYACTCLAYNPSLKDIEILGAYGDKESITIKIRDPYTSYVASNKHKVKIDDYRYANKVWDIINISYDLENNDFVKIILGASS